MPGDEIWPSPELAEIIRLYREDLEDSEAFEEQPRDNAIFDDPAPRRRGPRNSEGRGLCILRQLRARGCVPGCPCRTTYGPESQSDRVARVSARGPTIQARQGEASQDGSPDYLWYEPIPELLREPSPEERALRAGCGDDTCDVCGCGSNPETTPSEDPT